MTFRKILMGIIICALLYPAAGFAQETMALTLKNSVDYALQNNPEIMIAEKEVAKAKASIGEAYSAILPQVDASANFQHAWEIQQTTIPNFIKVMLGPLGADQPDFVQISFALENTLTYGATLNQPLFLGGAGIAGIQSANSAFKATKENFEMKRQDLIYRTASAFYSCLLTNDLISVQEEALAQAKANLDVVSKKYEVGSASGFDKMRAQVEVANLQPAVISARNNYQSAVTQLRTVLGLERDTKISISGELTYSKDALEDESLAHLQQVALQNRPELLALQSQKRIMQKGIVIARSNFLPKLFFSTNYSYMGSRNDLKFTGADMSKGFTSSLNLQIPLFHGFRSAKQYQKARLDYKIMLDSEDQATDGVSAEVEYSYNTFKEAVEKLRSANETVDLAKESLRLANLMYEEGTNTQLDVLNTQLALTQARMNYVSSLFEYQVARYALRKATGQLQGIL